MEGQRRPFRFRLPWLAQPPRPDRPTVENPRMPSQSTTSVPIRRPFTKPEPSNTKPTSSQTTTTTTNDDNNKPTSPSFVAIETPDPDSQSTSSKSVAISRPPESRSANDSPKTTQPAPTKSPSPVRPQSKVASPIPSPSKGDPKSKTSISPPSPSRRLAPQKTTAKTDVTIASQPENRVSSEPNPASSLSQLPSQEPELKAEIKSEAAKKVISPTQRPNSGAQESPEEEKSNEADYEEVTRQKPIAETPGSGNSNGVGSQEAEIQQKRENFSERKETLSMTSSIGEQIKTASPSKSAFRSSVDDEEEAAAQRQREIKEDISKLERDLTTRPQSNGKQVVVVTLTGENSGASMVLSSEQAKKDASIHIHRGYKANPDDSLESTTDGEEPTKRKKLGDKANTTPAALAYVNSNVQSINNSIIIEASVPGRNPGVHLVFSQKTSPEALKVDENKSKLVDTRKAEFTSTSADRLTHEPNVRRRCLRGLFLESSDSEPDNPNKPRLHGCRYSCGETKDKELM